MAAVLVAQRCKCVEEDGPSRQGYCRSMVFSLNGTAAMPIARDKRRLACIQTGHDTRLGLLVLEDTEEVWRRGAYLQGGKGNSLRSCLEAVAAEIGTGANHVNRYACI